MGVKLEHTRTPGLSVETVENGRELGLSFMTLSFCQIILRQGDVLSTSLQPHKYTARDRQSLVRQAQDS